MTDRTLDIIVLGGLFMMLLFSLISIGIDALWPLILGAISALVLVLGLCVAKKRNSRR